MEVAGSKLGRDRHGGAGAAEGDVEGGEVGRDSAGSGGGDDGWLRLLEKPLDRLAVRLVSQLTRELEHPGGTESRHSNSTAAAIDLRVPVFGRGSFRGWFFGGGFGGGCGEELVVVVGSRGFS